MKRILYFGFMLISILGCTKNKNNESIILQNIKSTPINVEEFCKDTEKEVLSEEEVAHWDSMNAEGGYMLIRNAERSLDTTVNHLHMIFITEN